MPYKIRKPNIEEQERKKQVAGLSQESRAQLLIKQPFVGMLAMRMELTPVIDFRLPTASTNGNEIFINPDYFLSLTIKQRIYIIAHEVWHCVFLHFKRRGNREHKKFNYAADLEVDFMLELEGFEPDFILPHKDEWRALSAESIYEQLEDDKERPQNSDVHIYEGEGTAEQEEESEGHASEDEKTTELVKDDEYNPSVGIKTGNKWREWVISTAQQIERTKGNLPAYLKELINSQYKPELDWKEVLQQFVSYCFGGERRWLPPNRRYIRDGLYLPSRKDEFLSVVVAVDTSGSTVGDLPNFLAELKGIVSSFGRYDITFIECDMEIQNVRHFNEGEPFEFKDFDFSGFGGTDFNPVFEHIYNYVEDPRLLIYLTDGYGDAPANPPEFPVLWILTRDGEPPADWGWKTWLEQKEKMDEEPFDRINSK
ncbi:MAG: DUF2201 family putative metallopeptidase [bacterium]